MLLEPPDKPEKLLHPDHAHEDLDMDLAMRPVLLGQRLLWLDMDHELEPSLSVLMPMLLGINIDMTGMLCLDGLCRNSEHARLLRVLFPLMG
jgi:hypothetical protein